MKVIITNIQIIALPLPKASGNVSVYASGWLINPLVGAQPNPGSVSHPSVFASARTDQLRRKADGDPAPTLTPHRGHWPVRAS